MKKTMLLCMAAVMTTGMLAGCGGNNKSANESKNNSNGKKEESNKTEEKNETIVYSTTGSKVSTLNHQQYTLTSESDVMSYICGNMLEIMVNDEGDNFEYVPYLAKGLPTMSEDGLTWTFEISEDAKWSDGTPITAETFEYTYKMLLDPKLKNYRAFQLFDNSIRIVKAKEYYNGECNWEDVGIKVDGNKLIISLEFPAPEMDFLMAFTGGAYTSPIKEDVYEKCFNEDKTENNYGTTLENTPSSGAYILKEWIRDQNMIFERNSHNKLGLENYTPDVITMRVSEDATTTLSLFENGDTDYVSVSGENFVKYEEDPRLVYSESAGTTNLNININSATNPILGNLDFRKAFFYALDRESIANNLYKTALPAPYYIAEARYINQGVRYRDTEEAKALVPENNGFNPDLAKEHFEKAFVANGSQKITTEIKYFDTNESMKKMAEFIEEEYEKLFGADKLDIVLRAIPWQAAYDDLESGNYEMCFAAMSGWRFNPYSFMAIYTSDSNQKNSECSNPEYDELYAKMMTGEMILNEPERIKVLARLEEILYDDCVMIPTIETRGTSLYADKIKLKTGGKYLPGVGFGLLQSEFTGSASN